MNARALRTPKKRKVYNVCPEKAYSEVAKLLYKLAWDFNRRYNIPFDECLSECHWAFVKALNWRYDPAKGTKFSSQCCTIATWRLKSLVRDRMRAIPTLELNEEVVSIPAPAQRSACLEVLEDLSMDAREIIALLLETPAELMEEVKTPKQLFANVRDYLLENGTRREDFNKAHAEIRIKFQEVWA